MSIPYNELPQDIKDQFYYAGRKGEWTNEEAYHHLIPEHLRDNPEEIRMFMNGGTIEQEVWVFDQGRGSGHYELIEVPDRDISRIQAGVNGGEYSTENTIMEDMSANRSRGGVDMTPEEYQQIVDNNAVDAYNIENNFTEKLMFTETEIIAPIAEESLLDAALGVAWEGVLPAVAAVTAGAYVGDKFEKKEDRLGYGALAAGGGALLAMTPIGQAAMLGFAGYKLFHAGKKVYEGLNKEVVIPVK
tara:strand:- start:204 stop:938 length:735 start_codon:yes stop_codon:yes gene_type:complete